MVMLIAVAKGSLGLDDLDLRKAVIALELEILVQPNTKTTANPR